jgi:RNA polymerase sigma-70 factor (ECF subfamily)
MSIDEMTIRQGSVGDVDTATDQLLVERAQSGDGEAFAQLYVWYSDRIARYCRSRLSDSADAEDAAQEAFARAWRSLGTFSGDRHFYPWLQVIAHNVCVDWNRRRRPAPVSEDQLVLLGASIPASDERALAALDGEHVVAALHNLAPRYREVLELREERSWSYQQIAEQNGVPISTIETLLFRARRALRKEFAALAGGDSALALGLMRVRGRLRQLISLHRASAANSSPVWEGAGRSIALGGTIAVITIAGVMGLRPIAHPSHPPQASTTHQSTVLPLHMAANDHASNARPRHPGQDRRVVPTNSPAAHVPTDSATASGSTGSSTSATQDHTAAVGLRTGGNAPTAALSSSTSLAKEVVTKTKLTSKGLSATGKDALVEIGARALADKKATISVIEKTVQTAKVAGSGASSAIDSETRSSSGVVSDATMPTLPAKALPAQSALGAGTSPGATVQSTVATATSEAGSESATAVNEHGSAVGVTSADARSAVNASAAVPR